MSHFNQKCDISEALKPLEQAILRCPDARERAGPVLGEEETQAQRARARRDKILRIINGSLFH